MARFTQRIKLKYDTKTYEGTKETYEWIMLAIDKLNLECETTKSRFLFEIGKIGCECNSIEEFTNYAYGQVNYNLINLHIYICQNSDEYLYISCSSDEEIYISATDKVTLERIVKSLEDTELRKQNKKTENINIQNHYNIGSINGNNNNIIQGNENEIDLKERQKKESKLKILIKAILKKLISS